jgi:glutaminase
MPAKSGVGGGIIAVLPGQLGIGVFSPPLDARGNSVRGVQVCQTISRDLGLHFLQPPRPSVSTVRARYSLANLRSKRCRPVAENRVLAAHGDRVAVFELQGDLGFPTIEPVLREIDAAGDGLRFVVLDFKRVTHVDPAATRMLEGLVSSCATRRQHLVLTRVRRGELLAGFGVALDPRTARSVSFQPQLDLGIEWCEKGLLEMNAPAHVAAAIDGLAQHRLCIGVAVDDLAYLEARVRRCQFEPGTTVVCRGEVADALYFLLKGEVSVVVELRDGSVRRLATLVAGMSFGESALMVGGVRSADVRADTAVECCLLDRHEFARLERERPSLMIGLLRNLVHSITETSVRLTAEVAALES